MSQIIGIKMKKAVLAAFVAAASFQAVGAESIRDGLVT